MLRKLDYIRRDVRMSDVNEIISVVNSIIDRLDGKIDIQEIKIEKKVKDFKFFNGEETTLPYEAHHTIINSEDAANIFSKYAFTYKELTQINTLLQKGSIVSLSVLVEEEATDKDLKQAINLQTIESTFELPQGKKKSGGKRGKKKSSWN